MPRLPFRLSVIACLIALFCRDIVAAAPLPGTQLLTMEGDIASQLVDGVDKFLLREIGASVGRRAKHGQNGYDTDDNRQHLARILGAADARLPIKELQLVGGTSQSAWLAQGAGFVVYRVRWPVLKGIDGEGLLLQPTEGSVIKARCVAIPDADQMPEQIVGLLPGVPPEGQFARRLAEAGCVVVVPTLVNRSDALSIAAGGLRPTNQPHREFIYRQAFEMGRHVIGFEVQKVLSLVDWFAAQDQAKKLPVGAIGYGEGGMLALYSGALDRRIQTTCVSGYFSPRERVWEEPIYRNVWQLLTRFGDAELAAMIAPRKLIVDTSRGPTIAGPPSQRDGRTGAAPGQLWPVAFDSVNAECVRANGLIAKQHPGLIVDVVVPEADNAPPCGPGVQAEFLKWMAPDALLMTGDATQPQLRDEFDVNERQRRTVEQMTDHVQALVAESPYVRAKLFEQADRKSRDPAKWQASIKGLRDYFYNDVIGRIDQPLMPANPRSRHIYDQPKHTGYEVVLDVFPDVIAYGILLVPKDAKQGEKRPVVVCQHGLEGRPQDVADGTVDHSAYHAYAAKLADEGFITFSPQNLYIFKDRFRTLQRKGNLLGLTLFSFIVPQHQQIVDWLATLPMVDPERIAFYGLSYGGKTAMRVPPLVDRYCLSICSGDFNEWIWKNTSVRHRVSYIGTHEYEIFEWNLGNTFNYAEMAGLIAPRPFMVERGHRDGVAPDEWVAYEFAKVRLLYADLNIADRAELEFFDGPHTIHGVGTFDFLRRHLKWNTTAKQ